MKAGAVSVLRPGPRDETCSGRGSVGGAALQQTTSGHQWPPGMSVGDQALLSRWNEQRKLSLRHCTSLRISQKVRAVVPPVL